MRLATLLSFCLMMLVAAGCGNSDTPDLTETNPATQRPDGTQANNLRPASIGSPVVTNASSTKTSAPSDAFENALTQIRDLKSQLPPKGSVDELRAYRQARNVQIAELALQVIQDTRNQPENATAFRTGVHELLEARIQLAMQGERDDVDSLYSDVGALEREYPGTNIASEGAIARIRLAHHMAKRYAGKNPEWLKEFSRLSRLFAAEYPNDAGNAVSLLFTAGRTCELHGLLDDAIPCFSLLREQFAKTHQGQQSFAILRRLNLPGQMLQFEGPTLNGKVVSVKNLINRVSMIYFWSSKESQSAKLAPKLSALHTKYGRYGLRSVGVNLDESGDTARAWLAENPLPGPQVFFDKPNQQRWENPIAQYYGVLDIPQVWLINPDGTVASTQVKPAELEAEIRKMLTALRDARKAEKAN